MKESIRVNLSEMTMTEMEDLLVSCGQPKFRGKQIFSWIYKGAVSLDEMSNLPKDLREKLKEKVFIENLQIKQIQKSQRDGTRKYLFGLRDGSAIESVYMQYNHGNSVCVSSQAGCRMGCKFCASTVGGLSRNLEASEIVGQLLAIERDTGTKISNVVVMGTGEPFDNYKNLTHFIDLIHQKDGLNLSLRNITVSTCGIVPRIQQFGREYPQVNLAVSLHAASDKERSELMPVNKRYPLDELLKTCKEHGEITGRRVTYEYTLVKGINDSQNHAIHLANKLRGSLCHVNLIPLNSVKENDMEGSDANTADYFRQVLEKRGVPTTVRRELGGDISAACGQLRLGEK